MSALATLPNEVIRMLFEHLSYRQKKVISRVSRNFRYLFITFPRFLTNLVLIDHVL